MGAINSDHCQILLDTNPPNGYSPRPFKFEAAWIRDPRSFEVVQKAWVSDHRGSKCSKLYRKQQNIRYELKRWNREVFGLCQTKINSLMKQFQDIQQEDSSLNNFHMEACMKNELNEWMLRSEILWRPKI